MGLRVRVDRGAFVAAVTATARVAGRRAAAGTSPPVVRLATAGGGLLTVSGAQEGVWVRFGLGADVLGEGEVMVSAGLLSEVAGSVGGEIVDLAEGRRLAMSADRARFDLALVTETVQEPKKPDAGAWRKAPGLVSAMVKCAFAAAQPPSVERPILVGVHVGGSTVMASDSYQIAMRDISEAPDVDATVPASALRLLPKVLVDGVVDVAVTESAMWIRGEGCVACVRLLVGTYPDIPSILPAYGEGTGKISLSGAALIGALGRAEAVLGGCTPPCLSVDSAPGGIRLVAESEGASAFEEIVPAEVVGWDGHLSLNGPQLLRGLQALSGAPQMVLRIPAADNLPTRWDLGTATFYAMPLNERGQGEREVSKDVAAAQ